MTCINGLNDELKQRARATIEERRRRAVESDEGVDASSDAT
jgi:hypothetical protein